MDALKKAKVLTAIAGVTVTGLLTACVVSLALSPGAKADTGSQSGGGGNTINIEVDPEVYEGVMAMLRYYRDMDSKPVEKAPESAEIVKTGETYCIVIDGKTHDLNSEGVEVVETEDGVYVIVDGKLYRLVMPDGSEAKPDDVVPPGTESSAGPDGTGNPGADNPGGGNNHGPLGFDDNGVEIVAYDDEGKPIIGYDDDGNPVYGYSNPRIRVDADGHKYYHIIWGDTLCKISSDVHISVDELAEYNRIRNVNLIYAESDLRLPDDPYWTEPWTEPNPNTGAN